MLGIITVVSVSPEPSRTTLSIQIHSLAIFILLYRRPLTPFIVNINPGINLRAAAINSNVSVSPRRYYHKYGDIIIHTTPSHTFVRVYNHD